MLPLMAEKGRECKLNFKIQYKSIYSHILEVSKQEQPKARKLAGNGQVQKINQNKYPKTKEKSNTENHCKELFRWVQRICLKSGDLQDLYTSLSNRGKVVKKFVGKLQLKVKLISANINNSFQNKTDTRSSKSWKTQCWSITCENEAKTVFFCVCVCFFNWCVNFAILLCDTASAENELSLKSSKKN